MAKKVKMPKINGGIIEEVAKNISSTIEKIIKR